MSNPDNTHVEGTKTLLLGATGTGKTYSLRTWIDAGITPFIISTEPGLLASLGDLDPDSYHYHYIAPAGATWATLMDLAKKLNTLSYEALTNLKNFNKKKYTQYYELLTTLSNFHCDHCDKDFGAVETWGTDRSLNLDSLSGINIMALDLACGDKPVKSPGDWGAAMSNLERLITTLCCNIPTHLVLTGHLEREKDEVSGGVSLMVGTLGQKLAPKIPRYFDNVVQATRSGDSWKWNTASTNVDLKTRHLPIRSDLAPDFGAIVTNWKEKGGIIVPTPEAGEPSTT
jgi:hypothetical protein